MTDHIKFNKIPLQTDMEIEVTIDEHFDLFKMIHPFTKMNSRKLVRIEVRAIPRKSKNSKGSVKSYNHYRNDEKGREYYRKFLKSINGKPYCLYYSVYTMDAEKAESQCQSTRMPYAKINIDIASYTTILVMDFDNITTDDYSKEKQRLKDLGIETISIFSGHGYQDIVLLNENVKDKKIIDKFTELLLRKGFKVDPSIKSAAQIMRLPDTLNCKAFEAGSKYYDAENPKAILTQIIEKTEKRYSVDEVFSKLENLDDDEGYIEPRVKNNEVDKAKEFKQKQPNDYKDSGVSKQTYDINALNEEYPYINLNEIPVPICNALYQTPEGLRNSVHYFLTMYLKIVYKLSLSQIQSVAQVWNQRCLPSDDSEFIEKETGRMFKYNSLDGVWDYGMSQCFGYLEYGVTKPKDKVIFNNVIFEKFDVLTPASVTLLVWLLLDQTLLEKEYWIVNELCEMTMISQKTIRNALGVLVKNRIVTRKKSTMADISGYIYSLNHFELAQTRRGYTSIPYEKLEKILLEVRLTNYQLKMYLYLLFMKNQETNSCYPSNKYLADRLGYNEKSIYRFTDALHDEGLIVKETYKKRGLSNCSYLMQ